MKKIKINFIKCLILTCILGKSSLGFIFSPLNLIPFVLPKIPFMTSIKFPFFKSTESRGKTPKNLGPVNLEEVLGHLDSVTSASAPLSELRMALETAKYFEDSPKRELGLETPKRMKRYSSSPITYDEIERWLDPVTSASASKKELRKILGSVFESSLFKRKKRSLAKSKSTTIQEANIEKRATDSKKLTLEDLEPYLDHVTSGTISKGMLMDILSNIFDTSSGSKTNEYTSSKTYKPKRTNSYQNSVSLQSSSNQWFDSFFNPPMQNQPDTANDLYYNNQNNSPALPKNIVDGIRTVATGIGQLIADGVSYFLSRIDFTPRTYQPSFYKRKRDIGAELDISSILPNILNTVLSGVLEKAKESYPGLDINWLNLLKMWQQLPQLKQNFKGTYDNVFNLLVGGSQ